MKTENVGIDYGLGKTNIDKNGIRYGVIHQNEVLQAWCDSSEPYYGKDFDHDDPSNDYVDPISFFIDDAEYSAESDDSGDIFITKSPFYTNAQFCSPCAPGAGYLMSPCADGPKTYCFGHDWYDNGKAPYPVYSVETGKLIKP